LLMAPIIWEGKREKGGRDRRGPIVTSDWRGERRLGRRLLYLSVPCGGGRLSGIRRVNSVHGAELQWDVGRGGGTCVRKRTTRKGKKRVPKMEGREKTSPGEGIPACMGKVIDGPWDKGKTRRREKADGGAIVELEGGVGRRETPLLKTTHEQAEQKEKNCKPRTENNESIALTTKRRDLRGGWGRRQ